MVSGTVTVPHNADGTKSISIGWGGGGGSGGVFTVNGSSGTATLNTIPRASTLIGGADWVAPNSITYTLGVNSSSFHHTIQVEVSDGSTYHTIVTLTGVTGSSYTWNPSVSENTTIFDYLNNDTTNWNQSSRVTLTTYDSSNNVIGTDQKTGIVSSCSSNTTSFANFYIGDTLSGKVNKGYNDSNITSTVQLIFGGNTYTLFSQANGFSWSYDTSTIADSLYSTTPNSNSIVGVIRIYTYYNGQQIQSYAQSNITASVKSGSSNPTFSSTDISYADTNTATTTTTGNNQYIIQNQSTFTAYINTVATGVNHATISSYTITCNGLSKTLSGTGSATLGQISSDSNVTLSVKATDSRGNSTTATKTVLVVPYSPPTMSLSALRQNNFGDTVTLNLSGNFSPVDVAGSKKNIIEYASYRYKNTNTSTWGNWISFSYSYSGNTYSVTEVTLTLSNLSSWDIEVQVGDAVEANMGAIYGTYTKTLGAGQPILFIDSALSSVGVNQFPTGTGTFEVTGRTTITSGGEAFDLKAGLTSDQVYLGLYADSQAQTTRSGWFGYGSTGTSDMTISNQMSGGNLVLSTNGGLVSSGSDLTLNNHELRNVSVLTGEYGTIAQSTDEWLRINDDGSHSEGTYFGATIVRTDGRIYLGDNGSAFSVSGADITFGGNTLWGQNSLWNGALWVDNTQPITPSKPLSRCNKGWVLVWSSYTSGANNYYFNLTFIPKRFTTDFNSFGVSCPVSNSTGGMSAKYIYVSDGSFVGVSSNTGDGYVLRNVYEV
jgi:hypothetical protein